LPLPHPLGGGFPLKVNPQQAAKTADERRLTQMEQKKTQATACGSLHLLVIRHRSKTLLLSVFISVHPRLKVSRTA
jgi:hypothetical protein